MLVMSESAGEDGNAARECYADNRCNGSKYACATATPLRNDMKRIGINLPGERLLLMMIMIVLGEMTAKRVVIMLRMHGPH